MRSRNHGQGPLSPREREIAALVAEGLTDAEIAHRLSISPRTVEGHVQWIRNKRGLANRTQIASQWTRETLGIEAAEADRGARPPDNLPVQLTNFIGRERELQETKQLLQRTRLLTVTGPGGCGKTRLAVQAAGDLFHRYPSGVWFVDLSGLSAQDDVAPALAEVLDIEEVEGVAPLETIAAELRSNRRRGLSLVVLDNCEHVIDGCAATVDRLLKTQSSLTFLCTTREPVHVSGETVYRLGPLSLPEPGSPVTAESARGSEAVGLFLDRVSLSDPGFTLTDANAADVVHLCRRLDGLPLALELAAARVGLMPFPQLVRHLDVHIRKLDRFGSRTHQQTLSATFRWSYDLLTDPERRLLRTLSVFTGGFTYESVEAVCSDTSDPGGPPVAQVLPLLVDKSLVVPVSPQKDRYRCLEIVRQHAWDLLSDSGELDAAYRSYVEYFLAFVERAGTRLTGSTQSLWLDQLADDHDNIRTALALSQDEDLVRRLRVIVALNRFWQVRGFLSEGREYIEDVLQSIEGQPPTQALGSALNVAAGLAWNQGDLAQARAWLQASMATWQALGHRKGVQFCLQNLALIACNQEEWEAARAAFADSLALARDLGDAAATGLVLCNLGLMVAYLDEHEDAQACLAEADTIVRGLEDWRRVGLVAANRGMAALFRGDDGDAAERYRESLRIAQELGARQHLAELLEGVACLDARRDRLERALRLAGAADTIRTDVGNTHTPFTRRLRDCWLPQARASLGEDAENAWDDGARMSEDAAMALATSGLG